jgi:hypothetical protein
MLGNKLVVYYKNAIYCLVVATLFYMIKKEKRLNFPLTFAWTDAPHFENHQKRPTIKSIFLETKISFLAWSYSAFWALDF